MRVTIGNRYNDEEFEVVLRSRDAENNELPPIQQITTETPGVLDPETGEPLESEEPEIEKPGLIQ